MAKTLDIGWFSTGRGPGSRGLLQFVQVQILQGQLPVRIQFVFCNREPGEAKSSDLFMELVRHYGIPLLTISSRRFRQRMDGMSADHRLEYDQEVMALIGNLRLDLCVLAGYMLIVGSEMCRRYTMLNLHPALPGGPPGTWQEVIWKLIESQAVETGVNEHIATEELDRGPVVSYCSIGLRGDPFDAHWRETAGKTVEDLKEEYGEELPLFRIIREEEYRREPHLLAATLRTLASGWVKIQEQKVLDSQGNEIGGLDLTQEVEQALERD